MSKVTNERLRSLLYEKYFTPTETNNDELYIGVEIEMPIIRLSGDATDQEVAKEVVAGFIEVFGFDPVGYDKYGICYSATDRTTGDNLSFDCSYNNLEISFGRERSLFELDGRFAKYVSWLNNRFMKRGHMLSGMGVNPNYHVNRKDFLAVPRYQMLDGFLLRGRDWKYPMYLHPFYDFATYSSASQVQLDVDSESLIDTIKAFSYVEPVKAVLFANSYMPKTPELLCARDMFWENSTHGINPHNIGMFEQIPESKEEFLEYILQTSIFCTEREGHYVHFKPIPIADYYEMDEIEAEYYENGVYHPLKIKPKEEDLTYLRTYKFEDLTYRGTIEFRSCCCQPFSEAMSVAAFHLGLIRKTKELTELLENDHSIFHHGFSAGELRKMLNMRNLPGFIDTKALEQLCYDVIGLAREGLEEREHGGEIFLKGLENRVSGFKSPARVMLDEFDKGTSVEEMVRRYAAI